MDKAWAQDRPANRMRGQPLVFLATVVLLWSLTRILQYLPDGGTQLGQLRSASRAVTEEALRSASASGQQLQPLPQVSPVSGPPAQDRMRLRAPSLAPLSKPLFEGAMEHQPLWVESLSVPEGPGKAPGTAAPLVDRPVMLEPDQPSPAPLMPPGTLPLRPSGSRWSVYGWSLVRQNGRAGTLAPAAQYGGSQAGLLVQMALSDTPNRPTVYARASSALASADDRSLALGISARPVADLPVDLAVERRMGLARGQPDRFALMLVAGKAWTERRSQIRLEGYGQAGVVGLTDPQAFFDVQMLATRPVHVTGVGTVSLGGGVWAGGQQNIDAQGQTSWTHRVDLGPRAAVVVPVSQGSLTLALDWRQRIDGAAHPASGAALTLSAGF